MRVEVSQLARLHMNCMMNAFDISERMANPLGCSSHLRWRRIYSRTVVPDVHVSVIVKLAFGLLEILSDGSGMRMASITDGL